MKLKLPVVIKVSSCIHCPFMWDGRDTEDVVRCTAVDLVTEFREIRSFRQPHGTDDPQVPPRWCPLRKRPHVVEMDPTP